MKKLTQIWNAGKEWVVKKWNGSAFDLFLLSCIGLILLTILSFIIGRL